MMQNYVVERDADGHYQYTLSTMIEMYKKRQLDIQRRNEVNFRGLFTQDDERDDGKLDIHDAIEILSYEPVRKSPL